MAHHGDVARPPTAAAPSPSLLGAAPVHRAHRVMTAAPSAAAAASAASATASASASASAAAPSGAEVTLESPRPDGERAGNEYVETPFRPGRDAGTGPAAAKPGGAVRAPHHHSLHLPVVPHQHHPPHHNNNKNVARTPPPAVRFGTGKRALGAAPVTKQPGAAATFKKDSGAGAGAGAAGSSGAGAARLAGGADCFRGSIICPECGRCRCESCRKPRALPSRWLCNNTCLLSAESVLDYASCLCCVKGLFYHCSVDYEGDASCTDDPCSCGPPRRLARWGCMGLLSLALPCLCCYWPLRACVRLCERCYARYSTQGCRCEPRQPKLADVTPEKRLLDASPDF